MTTTALEEAIAGLQTARNQAAEKAALAQAELDRIDHALAQLRADLVIDPSRKLRDFVGLGIIEAAKRYLAEAGGEKTTMEIATAIRDRGVTTKSKNFVPTVYATLTNSKEFVRKSGKWVLKTR